MKGTGFLASVKAVDPSIGSDNALGLQYYDSMLKWARHADTTFANWDVRVNCGHFFGGCYWYEIETAFTVALYAVLAKYGPYEEEITGVPRERILAHAIAGIRYLGFTHDTGPADCVRVEGHNPKCSGKKWGGKDDPFFQASQHGRPVSALGMAAWILWDELDDETRKLVASVVTSYAERWSAEMPRTGAYIDTQTEENAWTGQGIYIATCMFPDHPHASKWREAAKVWLMNVRSIPDDRRDLTLIDGKPVNSWVETVTTHPDFTVENHGIVHPFYQGLGIAFPAKAALWNSMMGQENVPEWLTWHMPEVYEAMKKVCGSDGQPVPVQGQDWWYEQHPEAAVVHCAMNVYFGDRDAAYLERLCVEYLKKVQDSNAQGRIYHSLSDRLSINPTQTIGIKEVYASYYLTSCYLMHHYSGPGVEPVGESDFVQKYSGVSEFPHGGFVVHRHAGSMTTFSWRNAIMALVMPEDGMWAIVPQNQSYIGEIEAEGMDWERPEVINSSVSRRDDGFAAIARLARCQGAVRQDVVFVSLPDGSAVYMDSMRALRAVKVDEIKTGLIGVRNEYYSQLADVAGGRRALYSACGEDTAEMNFEETDDVYYRCEGSNWFNVDDKIGYIIDGSGGILYCNKHRYPKWRGFEDTLVLNYRDEPQRYSRGETIGSTLIVTIPNQEHSATRRYASKVRRVHASREVVGALCGDYLVLGNFHPSRVETEVKIPVLDRADVPVFPGHQRVLGDHVILFIALEGLSSTYVAPSFKLNLSGLSGVNISADVIGDRLFLANEEEEEVRAGVRRGETRAACSLKKGSVTIVDFDSGSAGVQGGLAGMRRPPSPH